jgi:hypothetical protein
LEKYCICKGEERENILAGKSARRKSQGIPRHGWVDNIKICLKGRVLRLWTGYIWLRMRTSVRLLSTGSAPEGSKKSKVFPQQLSNYGVS